jgi:hypothetical protein
VTLLLSHSMVNEWDFVHLQCAGVCVCVCVRACALEHARVFEILS